MTRRLPPAWKIRRELVRIVLAFILLPVRLAQRFLLPIYHDYILQKKIKQHSGALPQTKKVAVYLIFPSDGLQESHLAAVRNIVDSGYSPLIVSNLPLSQSDLTRLLEISFRVLERPNLGYDFGGYRDGILSLKEDVSGLDRLALLNDSAWFPLHPDQRWLLDAEATPGDFIAANNAGSVNRVEPEDYANVRWDHQRSGRSFYYCSFAWSIGPRILKDQRFRAFWKSYQLRSNKNGAIKYGEIGFSRWVIRNGFSHRETYDLSELDRRLEILSYDDVKYYVRRLILLENSNYHSVRDQLLSHEALQNKTDLINFYLASTAKMSGAYAPICFTIEKMNCSFLKKLPLRAHTIDRDTLLAIAADIKGPMGEIIRAEAAELVKRLQVEH